MKSIILIARIPFDFLGLGRSFASLGTVHASKDRLVVESAVGWFALNVDLHVEGEMDEAELEQIRASIPHPFYYALDYQTRDSVELAINHLVVESDLLIDNDCGDVLPLATVRGHIASGVDWLHHG